MTKDEIFAIDDIKKEKVEVPEWNITVWVKTMYGHEFNQGDCKPRAPPGSCV